MQLLIKISDELYEKILNLSNFISADATQIIRDGIPLPKGHGRLFDERDIVNGNYEVIGNKMYEIEPIIEADIETIADVESE